MQPMLSIASRAARSAGELIFHFIERLDVVPVDGEGAKDYVVEVDRTTEQTIVAALRKAYLTHTVVGEEDSFIESNGEGADYLRMIDPLDGIINFICGVPYLAASITCKYKDRLEHTIVLDPVRQEEFAASRGHGAALNGHRLRISGRRNLEGTPLGTGFPFRGNQIGNLGNYLNMFRSLVGQTAGIHRAGAASLDLAYVAASYYDAFRGFGPSEWDMAAGALLIQRVGDLVNDSTDSHEFLERGHTVTGDTKHFKVLLTTTQPHLPPSLKH